MFTRLTLLAVLMVALPCLRVEAQNVTVNSSSPIEAKLAAIDNNTQTLPVSTIRRYARYLDRLELRCKRSRTRIADMVVVGRDNLRKRYNTRITLLKFLELAAVMMDESGLREQNCAETFALLVVALGSA